MINNKFILDYIKSINEVFIETSEWKPYIIKDLFDSVTGDFDIQKKHIEENGNLVVSSGVSNNGIIGKTTYQSRIFDENTITVDMFGNSFFRGYKYKMVTHGRVFSLKLKQENHRNHNIYLSVILNNILPHLYGYNNMCSWNKIEKDVIYLPSKLNTEKNIFEPDWAYMENFIFYLENKLNTNEINKQIKNIRAIEKIIIDINKWKEYKLNELFNIKGSKTTPKKELEKKGKGKYPYITTTAFNQGVSGYYDFFTEKGNILTFDSAVLGTCFYQEKDFSASDHVELGIPYYKGFNKKIGLFLQMVINKKNKGVYHYGHKANQQRIKDTVIKLPSKLNIENNTYEPDWQYMEDYISDLEIEINK
jgi:hypothetical protein